jgi:uncharacterized protein (DUF1684 family)
VEAKAEVVASAPAFVMPVFAGTGSEYVKYATLSMQVNGKPVTLSVYRNTRLAKIPAYADYLFLPFTDETNGKETYGGGRYIDLREADFKNGTVTIDFNKTYNPYCAFAGGYSCPKPPDENQLKNCDPRRGEEVCERGGALSTELPVLKALLISGRFGTLDEYPTYLKNAAF